MARQPFSLRGRSILAVGVILSGIAAWPGLVPATAQNIAAIDPNEIEPLMSPEGFDRNIQPPRPERLPENIDIAALREALQGAGRDAHTLYHQLRSQSEAIPGLRRYTGNLLRLQVRAEGLAKRLADREAAGRQLAEMQQLDSDWRQLSYSLGLLSGISNDAVETIRLLDRRSQQIANLLKIGPGVDYRTLVAKTNGLATAVDRLVRDLEYIHGRGEAGRRLIARGQNLEQQAMHLADGAFQQFEYDHLVDDFEVFRASWAEYLEALRQRRDPLIERDIQSISAQEREVATALRMEQTLDRAQLIYLVDKLSRDVDQFFNSAPLMALMKLPQRERALATADAFYGNFENFIDVAERGQSREDLQYAFAFIEEAWQDFAEVYRPLEGGQAEQALSAIENDVNVLGEALLIRDHYDRNKASELASKVEVLATYIQRDAESWLRAERLPNAAQIRGDVDRFCHDAEDLHAAIAGGAPLQEIRRLCEATFADWRAVYAHIINCRTSERPSLAASSSQTTPALIELRSVFGD